MNWNSIHTESDLQTALDSSSGQPVLIFKHSTRCSISSAALDRIERNWKGDISEKVNPYFLDLIQYRNLSNKVAEVSGVSHESPQALLFLNGKCIYHASHMGISLNEMLQNLKRP